MTDPRTDMTPSDQPELETLAEAITYVRERRSKGVDCPCCGRHVQVYRRRLNVYMVTTLTLIVAEWERTGGGYVYVETLLHARPNVASLRADFGKLRYWGLLERGKAGHWRPTPLGVDFVKRGTLVPAWVDVEMDAVIEQAAEQVDYAQIMGISLVESAESEE